MSGFKVPALVKKHPVATGAVVVVGALLVYMVLSGGAGGGVSASGGGGVSPTTDPAVIQANTALALAGIQAQTQVAGIQAQLQGQATDIAGQITIHQMDLAAQHEYAATSLAALNLQLGAARYDSETTRLVNLAGIDANRQAQSEAVAAALAQTVSNNTVTTHIADVSAATQIAQAQLFTGLQGIIAQTQASVAITQSNNQVNMAAITAHTQEYIAHQNAQTQRQGGFLGFLGNLLPVVAAFL